VSGTKINSINTKKITKEIYIAQSVEIENAMFVHGTGRAML
jgi:hypothetical protein